MRDIKFRAWHKETKTMLYFNLEDIRKNLFTIRVLVSNNGSWENPIMQYTDCVDIQGKDIYEGDIVIWNDGGGETEFNPKKGWIRKAIVKINPSLNFELTMDTPSGTPDHKFHFGHFMYSDTENHLKVIGNIYEKEEQL